MFIISKPIQGAGNDRGVVEVRQPELHGPPRLVLSLLIQHREGAHSPGSSYCVIDPEAAAQLAVVLAAFAYANGREISISVLPQDRIRR